MGRSGRHRQAEPPNSTKLRLTLVAAGLAAAFAVAAIAIAATDTRPSSAQMNAGAAVPDPPRPLGRAGRDLDRTPIAAPDPEPSDTPTATPPTAPRKKRHAKILGRGACQASYYGSGGHTASGESFDRDALTAAHRSLPLGSKVRVTNRNNDRSVVVRINDRGPFVAGRCLDLSSAAMQAVGGLASGVIPVKYEVLAKV